MKVTPDGNAVISLTTGEDGNEFWYIPLDDGEPTRRLYSSGLHADLWVSLFEIDPEGRYVAYSSRLIGEPPVIISIEDHSIRRMAIPDGMLSGSISFSRDGRSFLAVLDNTQNLTGKGQIIRVWDLDTGETRFSKKSHITLFSRMKGR